MTTGSDNIVVTASATTANGVGAAFNLLVDGVKIGSATVGTSTQNFTFHTNLAANAPHDVQVVYTNDTVINGQDRNLFLQSISVDGRTALATGSLEVYRASTGSSFAGSGNMYWNGSADFSLPANFLASSPPAYYVAVNGNDNSGNGSAASPFATLARAQVAMENSAIRTTYVEGGTYNLSASLMLTSADNGMSFLSVPGQQAVLNGAGAGLVNLVTLTGTQNVTLQGLTFENTKPGYSNGAVALTNATSNHILGDLFSNNDRGVLLNGSSGNVISGNEINNSVTAGINAGAASNNNTLDSNLINGTSFSGTGTGSAGIMITGGNNNAITHNEVENTAGVGIGLYNWTSDSSNLNIGNTIAYNSVINTNSSPSATDSGGIYIDGRAGANTQTVVNNNLVTVAGTPLTGTDVGIYLDDFTSGVSVTNNIVTGGNFAFLIHGGQNDALTNNIFDLGTRSASNIGAGLLQAEAGGPVAAMTGNTISQNIVYSTADASPNVYVNYGGAATIMNNLYYNTNGEAMNLGNPTQDLNPHWGNPQFANAAGGNYTLGQGSAASAINFQSINQSAMGLAPATAHFY